MLCRRRLPGGENICRNQVLSPSVYPRFIITSTSREQRLKPSRQRANKPRSHFSSLTVYCRFNASAFITPSLTSLLQRARFVLNLLLCVSKTQSSSLMTCFFPYQHHYPLPHDHMGSGCAVVCGRSGHALLPIHLRVRLFIVSFRYSISMFVLSGDKQRALSFCVCRVIRKGQTDKEV